jgi:hypothetical protein
VVTARLLRIHAGRRVAWVAPAAAGAAVTIYLAWGAWVSAADRGWLHASAAWWRTALQPGDTRVPLIFAALWLLALLSYWWPRRLQPRVVGITTVVTMVVIGGVLTTSSLFPCRTGQTPGAVAGWVLDLYVGNPPSFPVGGCHLPPALAYQLGGPVCVGATLTGAVTAAAVVWHQPVDRMRARLVRDATIFTGLDAMTMPLLERLAQTFRPASIVVIEPDASHPLLDQARATGAHVMIGEPSSPRVLLPVIAGSRGCALLRLYALRGDVTDNEAVLDAAQTVLRRYRPHPDRQPHLVARIDDPRHADHWRGWRIGRSGRWFQDALSAHESTASTLLEQVFRTAPRQLLLAGDSTLALAILRELARRAWERGQLADAAAGAGSSAHAGAEAAAEADQQLTAPLPVQRVVLLDRRAEDLRREYLATCPPPMVRALCEVDAEAVSWKDRLLATLDAMPPTASAETTVIVAETLSERGMHEAGRVARLHPGIPVFVLTSEGAGTSGAIFDLLHPFQRALLVDGQLPEDAWTRVARHWHECYRLSHPPGPADPRTLTSRPWGDLDGFIRQDNILQLRSIMTEVVAKGRRWVPSRAVVPGSFIELSEQDLQAIACNEHTRWYQRRLAAGWSAGEPARAHNRAGGRRKATPRQALVNSRVVPWAGLPADERSGAVDYLRSQLAQLEDVGFMPVVPPGGPPEAAEYRRVGTVRARRLNARRPWTRRSGDQLYGDAGDWRVIDGGGDERTVRDPEFRHSHEPLGGDFWLRTGNYRAWRVSQAVVLRTREGRATALPGDWVVEGARGERWPVTDDQFRRSYAAPAGPPPTGTRTAAGTQAPNTQAADTRGAQPPAADSPAANSPGADSDPADSAAADSPAVPPPRRRPPGQAAIRNP